jgi:hypothetical protein
MKRTRYELRMAIPEIAANSSPAHLPALGIQGQYVDVK